MGDPHSGLLVWPWVSVSSGVANISDLPLIGTGMPEILKSPFGRLGARQERFSQGRSPAVAIAGAVMTAALGVALIAPAGAATARASASAGANATTNVAGSADASI